MKKRVVRIIGLLPLLLAMTVLGGGVAAADPGTATLTKAETSLRPSGWGDKQWIDCTFTIDNPSEDGIWVEINWDPGGKYSGFYRVGIYSQATIRDTGSSDGYVYGLDGSQVSSIAIRGLNKTTGNTDFTETVPVPGSWP
jgi:hypothetical protein